METLYRRDACNYKGVPRYQDSFLIFYERSIYALIWSLINFDVDFDE